MLVHEFTDTCPLNTVVEVGLDSFILDANNLKILNIALRSESRPLFVYKLPRPVSSSMVSPLCAWDCPPSPSGNYVS